MQSYEIFANLRIKIYYFLFQTDINNGVANSLVIPSVLSPLDVQPA